MSKPSDVDALYSLVYWLKQITGGATPQLLQRKPYYEKAVRKQIVDTLVEHLKEDLASREEVTKLQKELETKNQLLSGLSTRTEELEKANKEALVTNTQLKKRVEQLEKDVQEYVDRLLKDPAAK